MIGPVKPGNGPGQGEHEALYARDLDDKANARRMLSKWRRPPDHDHGEAPATGPRPFLRR